MINKGKVGCQQERHFSVRDSACRGHMSKRLWWLEAPEGNDHWDRKALSKRACPHVSCPGDVSLLLAGLRLAAGRDAGTPPVARGSTACALL